MGKLMPSTKIYANSTLRRYTKAFMANYCIWIVFCTLITTFYTSSILSFILMVKYEKPIQNLDDVPDDFPIYDKDISIIPTNCSAPTYASQWRCKSIEGGNAIKVTDYFKEVDYVNKQLLITLTEREGLMPFMLSTTFTRYEREIRQELGVPLIESMYMIPTFGGNYSSANGVYFNKHDQRLRKYLQNIAYLYDNGIFHAANTRAKRVR